MMPTRLVCYGAALMIAAPALAACDAPVGWSAPAAHVAAKTPAMRFALKPGDAVKLALAPARSVKLAVKSGHTAAPGSYAGLAAIDVDRAGRLTVALSSATYVDLVRDGRALVAVAHQRTADCATMHKTVTFAVTPGRYLVELTDAPQRAVVMATTLS